ncbi:aspartate aminotransferase family protein [Melioribacteraceae bacterium 4301-Me]|uniref:aspartate aminotransferase family protein n=1 Tax=Pyranulibacter aquaticus TaxID=3163344 RepID=UPI00359B8049
MKAYQTTNKSVHGSFSHLKIADTEDHLLKNYSRAPIDFVKGKGAYLYDSTGKEYLDFLCGIAVTSFGHSNPQIKEAVEEQVKRLWHVSNLFISSGQKILADKLYLRSSLEYAFFCNSGTEANEAAIKFARKWGNGKFQIITALGGFHGRTYGSLSASGQYKLWEGFFPLTPGFLYVPFGDIEAIENSFGPHVVAVMLEPIQGEKGIIIPPEGYLKEVRKFCDEKGILLILDEVQAGVGRTGKFFAYEYENIKPDIVTLAKGIANGIPLGATLCSKKIGDVINPGDHGSTFGGNPIAVAAANKVLDLISDELLNHIFEMGEKIKNEISSLNSNVIKEVRGKGLMIGVELNDGFSAKQIVSNLLNEGVIVGTSGDAVLRILPPFIVGETEIEKFIGIFKNVLKKLI